MEPTQSQAPAQQAAPTQQTANTKKKGGGMRDAWKQMNVIQKAVTIVLAMIVLFVFYVVLDANKYRATVRTIEGEGQVGVNPTDQALDFGDLSRGTSAVRRVNMENGTFMPMFVVMWKTGKISELMKIDKNYFKLGANETTKIEYSVYMPASAVTDTTYNGRVYLFKIPTFGL